MSTIPNMDVSELMATIYALQSQLKNANETIKTLSEDNKTLKKGQDKMQEQIKAIYDHLAKTNEARTIEETLRNMSELGSANLNCDCTVYSLENTENNTLFTVNENNERIYLTADENSLIHYAISQETHIIKNNINWKSTIIGDGRETPDISNAMVIPLKNEYSDVIGVVVAKATGNARFKETDAEKFRLDGGSLGELYRTSLEKKNLIQEATLDSLTGLTNRHGMNKFIENVVLSRIKRNEPVSTVVIDIDDFKRYNTDYGHDGGDACLKMVADTMRENVRITSDTAIIRTGGDEMLMILPVDEAKAFEIAERVRYSIEEKTLAIGDNTTNVTLTLGVAPFLPENIHELNKNNILQRYERECFKKADENLYKAKEMGKNRTCGSDELMRTHCSVPSPTVLFGDFLNAMEMSIEKDEHGYLLNDDREEIILKNGIQTTEEIVSYLENIGIIEENLIYKLRSDCVAFGKDENGNRIFNKTGTTLQEWNNLLENEPFFKTPMGEHFIRNYYEEISTIKALVRTDEIKLDNIVKDYSPVQENKKKDVGKKFELDRGD